MNANERVGRDEVIQSISILILAGDSLGYLVCGIRDMGCPFVLYIAFGRD